VGDRLAAALDRAREVLDILGRGEVHKAIWGSPAGKTHLARRIVAEIPEHRVYVEPFAGGAQVLFTKEPSAVEVVSDLDPEIAFAFKFAKAITPEQLDRLRRKKWVGDKAHFRKLYETAPPEDNLDRFYRFAYLVRFSFNKLRRGTMPDKNVGVEARFVEKLERWAPRLKDVRVRCADYEKVIEEYDGPDTFFFLDPPYAGHDADCRVGAGHKDWDEARFAKMLRKIRGRFLCTYGLRGDAELFKEFHVRRWRHTSGVGTSQGQGLRTGVTLVATNYDPDKARRFQVSVSKTIWGSPAGKKKLAERLVALLPAHKTYVEPFAGSGAVLFAKDPAETEVINDADPDIAQAYRIIKRLTRKQLERLQRMSWTGDEATFKRLIDASPTDDVGWLHRFLYLTHFSYGKMRGKSFSPSTQGIEARTGERIEAFAPRLKNVRIYGGDYEKVVRKYDGPDTVFFLDPPYAGYNVDIGEGDFDEERFLGVLKSLEGKFLLTYGVRGKLPALLDKAGFHIKRIRTPRSIGSMRGVGGPSLLTQLVVANYELTEKADADGEPLIEDWDGQLELDDRPGEPSVADEEEVEKAQAFGTFGGSHHYAKRIVPLIPEHKTYAEPFAGAAAVLYVKEPSEKEVIADLDADVVFLHRSIKAMSPERVEELARRFEWKCTEQSFRKARDMEPKDEVERFYKLVFVRTHARDCRPDGTHPARNHLGSTTNPEKYLRAAERLKDVTVLHQDYRKTIDQLDGPDTFFFLDPPYPGEWYDKDAAVDLGEFVEALGKIKGRFIAVLNDSPENVAAFKKLGRVFRLKVHEASGTGGAKTASRLFCANFKVAKADDIEVLAEPVELIEPEETGKAAWTRAFINDLPDSAFLHLELGGEKDEGGKTVPRSLRHFPVRGADGELDLPHLRNAIARIPQAKIPGLTADDLRALQDEARRLLTEAMKKAGVFAKSIPLIKGMDPDDERYVLGVVLEPEVVDAQGDIYSAEEVRQAAHRFMEEFGGLGLMHRFRVNDQVKVLESYLAPVDLTLGGATVRKGTWLLAVRILSDELWEQVKDGQLTGFSIGGSARRVPEGEASAAPEDGQRSAA
jgi:DNA adenine methylase